MRLLQSTLTGQGLKRVVDVFGSRFQGSRILWADNTALVVAEDFSWRTSSNLLLVVAFVFSSETVCTVMYVSGGGGQGILGLDWGSEGNRSDHLVHELQEVAAAEGWELSAE